MSGTSESMLQTQTLQSLYTALDPKSLILSQFSNLDHQPRPHIFQLTTTDSFFMEKGPRYKAYADLREKKLRIKNMKQQQQQQEESHEFNDFVVLTPPKKQVKFQETGSFLTPPKRTTTKGSSILAQSVPDFSSALRKENRKPPIMLPILKEKSATPPLSGSKSGKFYGNVGGSKSVNSSEKKSGGGLLMARKSYANVEELKGLASVARSAIINGENRITRTSSRVVGKTVLGCRQL